MVRAVVDVGSNSVLLTVAAKVNGVWTPILETSEVTGLGEGTKATGVLGEAGMDRTLGAIRRAWDAAAGQGCDAIVAAATMAARIAGNTTDFLDRAERQGTPVQVLAGLDEAELGFRAVADDPAFAGHGRISIIDPGGHSTELVTAARNAEGKWAIELQRSFPIGTLAMLSGVFEAECPSGPDQLRACLELDQAIGLELLPGKAGAAITLGATGTNLVCIREQWSQWMPERVHGNWLDYEEVSKAVSWLSAMPLAERSKVIGMEPGREKTLHAGALILERFLHAIRALGCFVSVRGWRHALLGDERFWQESR